MDGSLHKADYQGFISKVVLSVASEDWWEWNWIPYACPLHTYCLHANLLEASPLHAYFLNAYLLHTDALRAYLLYAYLMQERGSVSIFHFLKPGGRKHSFKLMAYWKNIKSSLTKMRGKTWQVRNGESQIVRARSVKMVLLHPGLPHSWSSHVFPCCSTMGLCWYWGGKCEISTNIQYMPPNVILFVRDIYDVSLYI